jgi:alpha-D-xyloside xylohydrolase
MEIGGVGSHEPWAMPTKPAYDEEMIRIFRRWTRLHVRLLDYTYALAERAAATGDPIVHPLVFDWPEDPRVKNRWDEYLYGPALLVAPVWETGRREREVYLPAGKWRDLWDARQVYEGPAVIQAKAPLAQIPVYVRLEKESLLPADLTAGLD